MIVEKLLVGMFGTNCYLAVDEKTKEAAVIDPGDDAGKILAAAERLGSHIGYIFLTHSHFDHILAVAPLKEKTGAKVVIHASEAENLKQETVVRSCPVVKWSYKEAVPDFLAQNGDSFQVGDTTATYMHTPGHTPGSCVILMGEHLFAGDTLFQGSCGRCDLPGGDEQQMAQSLAALYALPGDYIVYPGHMGTTTLEEERKTNPFMKKAVKG